MTPHRAQSAAGRDPLAILERRVRLLPDRIEAARRRLRALENEARRYGFTDLLMNGEPK